MTDAIIIARLKDRYYKSTVKGAKIKTYIVIDIPAKIPKHSRVSRSEKFHVGSRPPSVSLVILQVVEPHDRGVPDVQTIFLPRKRLPEFQR